MCGWILGAKKYKTIYKNTISEYTQTKITIMCTVPPNCNPRMRILTYPTAMYAQQPDEYPQVSLQ